MKKILCLLLVAVMAFGLCACQGSNPKEAAFQVGFGRVNITPSPNTGMLLDNYDDRWSEGVLNYVFATCVAITDTENNTLLLYTLDMCNTEKHTAEALRE